MKQNNELIGERIRLLRKRKRMSMKRLGELVNLHESTISRYEKGEIQALDIAKLKEFAFYLDTTPEFIMGWSDNAPINNLNLWIDKTISDASSDGFKLLSLISNFDDDKIKTLLVMAEALNK